MRRPLPWLPLVLLLLLAPALAQAGWIIEWSTSAANAKGASVAEAQTATQSIAGNRVRLEQPHIITLIDYGQDRFTLINPTKQYFWSGTTDQYVQDMTAARTKAVEGRMGDLKGAMAGSRGAQKEKDPSAAIDPATLPPVSVSAAGTSETIAGYEAAKYEVRVDGQLYEELWVAPLDLSADLDGARFLAQQQKMAAARAGKALAANAVYRSPDYAKLFEKGFALKTVTHHNAGTFERKVTAAKQADVAASAFEVPEGYRKVRLGDLLDPPPTPGPRTPGIPPGT